ncbi:putative HMP/thiamine-binding protein YkoF [Paenibacillus sp. J31TS4]|uniref:YkoF family thiamine/hydroxymethylpyrimidine-binding protein n=1 Tax=Paenibacillus sp. J31TS4 TaxID=2807195 RepID=UPI001B067F6C|nr:YkoF family thiamine/hydroxymethylpyrimidine-binding protein [Paenibacillus sp. J31TS4]GIP40434.1 putative HMP/thiamine-binding protein YkoF [Paenibacillus sp. J31TS4]
MQKNECGTSRIVGARFSLYPMSGRFVEIITGALAETASTKVWSRTDDVSTCIRGRSAHVFDVAKAVFLHAAKTGEHVVWNGTFSIGCPGDSEGDVYMSEDDVRLNEQAVRELAVPVSAQFALYPLGVPSYMAMIADAVELARERGTFGGGIHYASRLLGDAHEVFATLEEAFAQAQTKEASHVVMTVNLSANSPSAKPEAPTAAQERGGDAQ